MVDNNVVAREGALFETARAYAHGAASEDDVKLAALHYADAVRGMEDVDAPVPFALGPMALGDGT